MLKYILFDEFKDTEGEWPSWYKGVSSMYAIEIGTNFALVGASFQRLPEQLDHNSNGGNVNETAHIHCFHGFELFSKFKFMDGEYDWMKSIDFKNSTSVPNYCMMIVLGQFDKSEKIEDPNEYAIRLLGDAFD